MGNNSKIALARFRIANLEQIIEDIRLHNETRAPNTPLGVADSVSADLEAQVDKMANSDNTSRAPTDSVFDVEMEGFPRHCDTKDITLNVLANITMILCRTLDNSL
ncbi:hypothetical protein Tco_1403902 [Tanacetum coccineum]